IPDHLHKSLTKSSLMCSTLSGMLTVYERIIFFAVSVGVGNGNFYVFFFKMNDRIEFLIRKILLQKIVQTSLGKKFFPIEINGQASVEIGIIPQHSFHILKTVAIIVKNSIIGNKCYFR